MFKPNAVSSWSRNQRIARDFARGEQDSWVIFEIRGGTSVGADFTQPGSRHLLPYENEKEVIIPRMKYRVVEARQETTRKGKTGWHIVVEEVGEQ